MDGREGGEERDGGGGREEVREEGREGGGEERDGGEGRMGGSIFYLPRPAPPGL